jgi:TM2 domain-containing membrane protein YozV
MYFIIGADGRRYGPVSTEQIRQWIRDGRANANTLAQVEGGTDWKPLCQFQEFALVMPAAAPPPVYAHVTNRADSKVAAGICGILLGGLGVHKFILGYTNAGLIMLLVTILSCGVGGIVMHVIGLIEGVIYLTKPDEEFVRTYVDGRKEWF